MAAQPVTPVPDFFNTAQELEELVLKLGSIDAYKLLAQLRYAYEDLDQQNTDLRRECNEHAEAATEYEIKLEDVYATFDAMQTGYRDFSDLARVIQA